MVVKIYCCLIVKDKDVKEHALVNDEQLKKFKKENGK